MSNSLRPHESQQARSPCPSSPLSLLKLLSIESVMPSSHLILYCTLLLLPIPPSIRVFSNESTPRIRWPKCWSLSFSISPFNEHPGLISFRMDWLDLLAVQGTLKSLLQHHSSKASILRCSVFFPVQLSHPYMTTGKTIALARQTFVGKVMSLLFNMLFRLVITFLPRSKHLLFSWLQSPFKYDLNQIPYDYTVEVTNRVKGLDLIECLMNYGQKFVTLYRRQGSKPSPRKRNGKHKIFV